MHIIEEQTRVKLARNLLETEIDDEVVALDVSRGLCFGLDVIGSRIWCMLRDETSAEEICLKLTQEFEVSKVNCLKDVCVLLNQLHADGLVSTGA